MEIEELHVKEICTRQNKINMHVPNTLVQFEIVVSMVCLQCVVKQQIIQPAL